MKKIVFYLAVIVLMVVSTIMEFQSGEVLIKKGLELLLNGYLIGVCSAFSSVYEKTYLEQVKRAYVILAAHSS